MRVAIYHNILWSKYKGAVFTEMYAQSRARDLCISFVHIAETEGRRVGLSGIDLSYHKYPYRLLFRGSNEAVFWGSKACALVADLLRNPSDLAILPGYDKIEYWAMMVACVLLRRNRAVFCDSTIHDNPQRRFHGLAKRIFFSLCDGYFCYGTRSKEYLLHYGAKDSKIIFRCQAAALPHNYDRGAVMKDYENARLEAPAPQRFVYVGRLSAEKGIADLINAFSLVKQRLPDATLDLIGAGELRAELEEHVRRLHLESSVHFRGSQNIHEIAGLLVRSAALVLPSHSEPWGLVVNEALSYGCPVVVSNICGCVPELVIDGVTGYSFRARDIQSLYSAMLAIAEFFTDKLAVAERCLDVIQKRTADYAASQILDGCAAILDGTLLPRP